MHKHQETWAGLRADNCQLLVCDLQEEIVARSKTTALDSLAQSAEVLCEVAQLFNIPITFSVVPEQQQEPKLLASLRLFASDRKQFLRADANPFLEPKTTERLASPIRKTLFITGFAIEVVILHAAVQALQAGDCDVHKPRTFPQAMGPHRVRVA